MKTSIIICTYNEVKTISNVVVACCEHNPKSEIIIIDDGSTDETENVLKKLAEKYLFKYEKFPKNKGKSWAMVHGVEKATGEIILFFDADLYNIKKEHFDWLLKPILENSADMVLGQSRETVIHYYITPFRSLSGQRALLKKDILPILEQVRDLKFGIETFLNLYYQAKGKRIKYVIMEGLKHFNKYEKTTATKATKEFINEGRDIAMTLLKNHELIAQRIEFLVKRINKRTKKKIISTQGKINNRFNKIKNELEL